ncbi:MAG: PQQ-binding-like beta-propeller repeat protein, partial [Bacteroidota bacterium]
MKNIFRLVPLGFLSVVFLLFTTCNSLHAQWVKTNGPGASTTTYSLAVSGTNLFAGTEGGGIFLSSNNGISWTAVNTGLPSGTRIDALAINGINIFAGDGSGFQRGIYLSTNNGANWTAVNTGLLSKSISALAISDTNIFAGTGGGVFLSSNNGASWAATHFGPGVTYALAVNGMNLFAASNTTDGPAVYLSTNNGASWTVSNIGLAETSINTLAIDGTNLYAGTAGDGIFLSTDSGASWSAVNTGLPTGLPSFAAVRSLAVSPNGAGGTNLFAGTDEGVYLSTNNGTSWSKAGTGLTSGIINSIIVSSTNLFAGVGNSVWRLPLAYFSALSPPILNSPSSATLNQPLSPTLYWIGDSAAFSYRLQVSKDSLFASIDYDDSTITTNSRRVNSLTSNTAYYWRLMSSNLAGKSQWSSTWKFTTRLILPPNVIAPANGSVNQPLAPTLSWSAGVYPSTYHLQVAKDSTFSSPVFDNSSLTVTSKQVVSLVSNTVYYWRVATTDSGNTSSWSPAWYFTTRAILTPSVISPANGSVNQPLSPTLSWSAGVLPPSTYHLQAATDTNISSIPYIFAYHLQVATDSNFSAIIFDSSTITTTSEKLRTLASNTTYYWRLMTLDSGSTSAWVTSRFTTRSIYPPPLVSPANGSVKQPLSPTLSWNEAPYAPTNRLLTTYSPLSSLRNVPTPRLHMAADTIPDTTISPSPSLFAYRLQVATDSNFLSLTFDNSNITTTSKQLSTLAGNTIYYWHVMTLDSGSTSVWSSLWNFMTDVNPPSNFSALAGNDKISLTWLASSSSNIIKYKIYRGTSSPASTLHDSTTATSYIDTGLTNGTKYFYRITTENNQYLEGTFSAEVTATPFNQPPHAASLQSMYDPNAGNIQSVLLNFSSTGSSDPDGTVDSVFWFVNGNLLSKQPSLTYSFAQGTNQVKLVVQDNQGARDSSIATINRLMFKASLNGPVYAGPSLLGENILYVIGTGDAVYRMSAVGNVLYSLKVGGEIRSSSSIAYDTTAYIASSDNNLYAFSGNGTSLWPALPLGGELSATAAIDSVVNLIYIGVANGNFVAVDRTAGKAVWNYFADAPIVGSAAMTLDRKLVVATVKGTVYGFDLNALSASPTPSWQISLADSIFGSPAIDAAGNIYYCTGTGKIDKITMPANQQASTVWQTQVGGSIDGSPVIDGSGTLYVGCADGKLYAIDIQSGNIKWSYSSGAPIFSTPTISNVNMIYFGNHGGEVFAIDTNEVLHWYYQDSTSIDAPLLYNNGVLYAGTIGGRLIAFYDNADSSTRGTSMTARLNKVKNITSVPVWGT